MTDFNEDHSNTETKLDEDTGDVSELELLKQQLEAEQALRTLAEQQRDNTKKDLIALKKGKKRAEVDLSEEQEEIPEQPVSKPKETSEEMKLLKETIRVNAELARALQNKTAASVGASGGEEPPAKPQTKQASYWSEEQKNELRKRGWNDEKIARAEKTAREGSATSSFSR